MVDSVLKRDRTPILFAFADGKDNNQSSGISADDRFVIIFMFCQINSSDSSNNSSALISISIRSISMSNGAEDFDQ